VDFSVSTGTDWSFMDDIFFIIPDNPVLCRHRGEHCAKEADLNV
jgi:hypothetical protein